MIAAMVVLLGVGFYMMMDRSLTRIILGFLLAGNGTNILVFLMSGSFGKAPISNGIGETEMSDPLPQAFILTAIVITFGVTAFMLALMYRSWTADRVHSDTVLADEEDIDIATEALIPAEEILESDISSTHEFDEASAGRGAP